MDKIRELAYWQRERDNAVLVAATHRSDFVREMAGRYAEFAAKRLGQILGLLPRN